MRETLSEKAERLLSEDRVKLRTVTENAYYFDVLFFNENLHDVFFIRELRKWSCTCKHRAITGKECSDILACKLYLSRNFT